MFFRYARPIWCVYVVRGINASVMMIFNVATTTGVRVVVLDSTSRREAKRGQSELEGRNESRFSLISKK
jgi:hypothetical protein